MVAQDANKCLHSPARASGPDAQTLAVLAVLLWEDYFTNQEIADAMGIGRRTLQRWKHRQDVQVAIEAQALGYRPWSPWRDAPTFHSFAELGLPEPVCHDDDAA